MKRGDIVVVAARGPYTGKSRPAVVVQSDMFNPTHGSVTVCPVTSDCVDADLFRVTLLASPRTGLRETSQAMVDKLVSVPRDAVSSAIGSCTHAEMDLVDDALRRWLGLD